MGGQRRAFALVAMAFALALGGCSANVGAAPEELCGLSATGTLERQVGGGYIYTFANGTTARIAFANGACVLDQSPVPIAREERSEWELEFTYDYYLMQLGPCLNGFGFPLIAPPERDDFVDSGGDWSPYDSVLTARVSGSMIAQLNSVCPRRPPVLL